MSETLPEELTGAEIAVVAMAGRFPRALNLAELWQRLRDGEECISFFSDDALRAEGVSEELIANPRFVKARAVLDEPELFDADFFGFTPREAEITDPQQRHLLECAWQALEEAGYASPRHAGVVGVFAASSFNSYLLRVVSDAQRMARLGEYRVLLGNDKDFVATWLSYKLDLTGPSLAVQTACSSSLVAVHLACQSLLNGECDVALAGGASVSAARASGYLYREGGISSPDGHCRTFDAAAQGTLSGDGAAIVVLRRLEDALAAGDRVRAVIRGTAINNDGSAKVGFTAPSVQGQSKVIREALAVAGVEASTVSYVEAHGTGTRLGDPVEVDGLTQAFGTDAVPGGCRIGSIKTNIGHLDAAAGIAGLIKVVLALEAGEIPPSLHYQKPNPLIDFATGPFRVNAELTPWPRTDTPRRAGVSSFGIGGTNAHAVLEEAPPPRPSGAARRWQLLPFSAKTPEALDRLYDDFLRHFETRPEVPCADVAYTLQVGRRPFAHRRIVVTASPSAAEAFAAARPRSATAPEGSREVVFLFPGQGAQHPGMGEELYAEQDVFRDHVDRAAEVLAPHLGADLRPWLFPPEEQREAAAQELRRTAIAQPALFTVEYALAALWQSWGIEPTAMIGHSVGELVAATLAGVFSFEDALLLVAERGRLMQEMPGGAMLAVPLSEEEATGFLTEGLVVAAVNAPQRCVVAGAEEAVDKLATRLETEGLTARRLHTSHAFHSPSMDAVVEPFTARVAELERRPPRIPFLSNVTGTWIAPGEATDPAYWGRQLRSTVRFADGIATLAIDGDPRILLECGPGILSSLVRQQATKLRSIASLPAPGRREDAGQSLMTAVGLLWLVGVDPDWQRLHEGERRHRVTLPTYPLDRRPFWIEPSVAPPAAVPAATPIEEIAGAGTVAEPVALQETLPMPDPQISSVTPEDRRAAAFAKIRNVIQELVGIDADTIDPQATFFDLGVDSLMLIQANQMIETHFGVHVSLIQLLEELTNLDNLAAFLAEEATDERLGIVASPPAAPAAAPAPAAPTPVAAPAATVPAVPAPVAAPAAPAPMAVPAAPAAMAVPAAPLPMAVPSLAPAAGAPPADGSLAQTFAQQLAALTSLMTQQLQLLGQAPVAVPAPAAVSPPAAAPTPAAAPAPVAATAPAPPPAATDATQGSGKKREGHKPYDPYEPVRTELEGALLERQEQHLQELIESFTQRTAGSKRFAETYRPYLADNRWTKDFRLAWKEMIYPIVCERSSGSRVWDVDGNEYVDIAMGFGLHLFGHSPEFLTRAVTEQLGTSLASVPQNPIAGRVAEKVSRLTGVERVTFMNSGTEAVIAALRVARTFTGRNRIARFFGAYHGWSDATLLSNFSNESRSLPGAPGVSPKAVEETLVLAWDEDSALEVLEREVETLAAVIVEPVQSRRPDIHPRRFLQEVRRITREHGVPLIFDEMITGFRIHPGGAQHHFDVQADLVIYGKALSGGLPLGVVAGRAELMDVFDGGSWSYGDDSYPRAQKTLVSGAYFKNPLTMAVALAIVEEIERRGPAMQEGMNALTTRLVDRLNALFQREQAPLEVVQFGSLFRFFTLEKEEITKLFFFHLIEEGVLYSREGGNCFLSPAHDEEDVDLITAAAERSVAAMQRGGYFPPSPGGDESSRRPRPPAAERVAVSVASPAAATAAPVSAAGAKLDVGLYFFGSYEREYRRDKYDLLLEAARFGDRNGFSGIWLPERHFNAFGGLSPNPSLLAAALARETRHLRLRAGSVVIPLHSPVRVAEEWALVDNLSGGRAEVGVASGWHPNDFVFAPGTFDERRQRMDEGLEIVRSLWRGGEVTLPNGKGEEHTVKIFPAPSRELPVWLTAASPSTYEKAGRLGVGILTNLWNQPLADLKAKFDLYRENLATYGHPPESAQIAVLLHTYLDGDAEKAREVARRPMCEYLRRSLWLLGSLLGPQNPTDLEKLPREELDYLLNLAYDRWVADSALIGSPDSCRGVLDRLAAIGVTEVGCFIDFGVEPQRVLAGLEQIALLRRLHRSAPAAPKARHIPTSGTQRNLYILGELGLDAAPCNEPLQVDFGPGFDRRAATAALKALCNRHEALRLHFVEGGEAFVIEPHATLEVPQVDLSALPPEVAGREADRQSLEAARTPIDPRRAPLLKCLLLALPGEGTRLLKITHHAIVDAHAGGVMMDELRELYAAFRRGERPELPPPRPFDARTAAVEPEAQRRLAERNEAYWLEKLAGGLPVLNLPSDRPRPPMQTFRTDRVETDFDAELTARLRAFSRRTGNTSFVTLLGGLSLLLHRLSGDDEVLVGINALQPDLDTTPHIGFHLHPVAVLSRTAGIATVGEYLTSLRRAVAEAYGHKDVSFARVLQRLGMRRDPSRLLWAAVVFNVDQSAAQIRFDDLTAQVCSLPCGARADLTINASERSDSIHFFCDYVSALYEPATVTGWLGQLAELLTEITEDATAPLQRFLTPPPAAAAEPEAVVAPSLTRYQRLLWLGQQIYHDKPVFNVISLGFLLPPGIDLESFEQAFAKLVASSDALRTVIKEVDGVPQQRVLPNPEPRLELVDLSHEPESLEAWLDRRCARLMSLDRQLYDSVLIRLAEDRFAWYLQLHHTISDHQSLEVAFRAVERFYGLARQGRLEQAEPLPRFLDYVDYERQLLETPRAARARAYWEKKLAEEIEPLAFYGQAVAPSSTRIERRVIDLGPETSRRLEALAAEPPFFSVSADFTHANLFATLVCVFLFRISGNRRLSLGMPVHNRHTKALSNTIGLFMQILPQRITVERGDTLASLARKVADESLQTIRYREFPVGNPTHRRTYEVEYNYMKREPLRFDGQPVATLWPQPGHGTDSLVIQVAQDSESESFQVHFDFHHDVFPAHERRRALRHFRSLVEAALRAGDRPVDEILLLTTEERQQILTEWNDTALALPERASFPPLFAEQMAANGRRRAVESGNHRLTYAALGAQAARLASRLRSAGVGRGAVVALVMDRGAALLTSILGVFAAGAAYLPLDPRDPERRIEQILERSGAAVVLTRGSWLESLSQICERLPGSRKVRVLELEDSSAAPGKAEPPEDAAAPDDLAYVIYTSGSTGLPKGAMVTQQGMVNHLQAKVVDLGLTAKDIVAQTASQCFDISVWQYLAPLLVGGRTLVVDEETAHDPAALIDLVADRGVTVLETVPSMLRAMLEELVLRGDERPRWTSLRWLLATGEALPPELCRSWLELYPAIPVMNAFGPTECSDDVTHHVVRRLADLDAPQVPIGRPVANTELWVLDGTLRPVPVGVPGELGVTGLGVGRGYLHDPRRTAAVFVPDPFAAEAGGRLYRTGDLGRHRTDGALEFLGRLDHQVKVRGFRIELGEIETVLGRHQDVAHCAVDVRQDGGQKFLVAYVVAAGGSVPPVSELRSYLLESLPEHMVPPYFVILEALPLTPNGKLDRAALPAPERTRSESDKPAVAARNRNEKILSTIWSQVFKIPEIGVHDDFFELGGDSLLSIQIASKVHQAGFQLSPMQLFRYPTIAKLAEVLGTAQNVEAEQGPVRGPVPLTPVQHWFFEHETPSPEHWNQAVLLEVAEKLEAAVLERSTRHLLAHHDALRMRFTREADGWRQHNPAHEAASVFIAVDLSSLPDARQRPALEAAAERLQASLDLTRGPLARVASFRLGARQTDRLLVIVHHLVVDGVSWPSLLEDLDAAYQSLARGEDVTLPPKSTSFQRWAQKLETYARSNALEGEHDYWLSALSADAALLPRDAAGPNTMGSAQNLSVSLEPGPTQTLLEELPAAYGVNVQSVLLAALTRTFQEWTDSPSLWVELEEHGREELFDDVDLTRTVGWFTCIYPVRLELTPAGGNPEADMRAIEQRLKDVPGRGLGFGLLRYLGEGETSRRLRAQPTPGVSFNYLGQLDRVLPSETPFRPARESGGKTHSGRGKRFRLLDINAMVLEGQLRIQWSYSENVHHRETVEKLARRQLELLQQWIAHLHADAPEGVPAQQETPKFAEFAWAQEDVAQIVELLEQRK